MKIKFYVKRNYGVDRAYFVDEEIVSAWKQVSGRMTLTPADFKALKVFGGEFEKVDEPNQEKEYKQEEEVETEVKEAEPEFETENE